jgi:hypothetical protein
MSSKFLWSETRTITADTGHTAARFIGEFGVALVSFTVAVAWYCWHHPWR